LLTILRGQVRNLFRALRTDLDFTDEMAEAVGI
jgi:hypothetical protein